MSDWAGQQGEHWARHAARFARMLGGYGELVAEAVDPKPGERVLDVGCGNGDLTLLMARAVGGNGAVRGVDLSPDMLRVAARQAADAGLTNVTFDRADATTYQPDPAGFDALVSRFGVMFFADPVAAFTNLRSLLATDGRLAFACWQPFAENDWMSVPASAVVGVLPLPTAVDPTAPGPFAFADPDRVTGILRGAGFSDVSADPVEVPLWAGDDLAEAVELFKGTRVGSAAFADADAAQVEEAERRIAAALTDRVGSDGIVLGSRGWLVTARA